MSDGPDAPPRSFEAFASSHLFRVLSLGLLVLLLQIPVGMIGELIRERQLRRDVAVADITGKWGGRQDVIGPLLVVPYEVHTQTLLADGSKRTRKHVRHATFLAESLAVDGSLQSEVRERGIFEVPVYDAALRVSGHFARPDFAAFEVRPDRVQWERAVLSLRISDARAIQDGVALDWGGSEIAFQPGLGDAREASAGIHAPLTALGDASDLPFGFDLRLHGSGGLYFAPLGRDTEVALEADWPHPSFQGAWLPQDREVGAAGFAARWRVPHLGRSYPQAWTSDAVPEEAVAASRFGVDFVTPVDPYRLAERAAKYDLLFVGLTFLSLWLFEVLAGIRVHAVQYLLVGGAMSLFYLLLLALSEHLGVGVAYGIAATGIVVLITCYAIAVLTRRSRAAVVGGVVAALYANLYVLLHNEDHALLVGSVGLFAALALVMWLTRRVDWFDRVPAPRAAVAASGRASD
jgi:inner membrane protein